ncbi:hypothetical protein G9A89_019285 [Geosiphon pyriformis]|nr:hypothetical protein G9A89_019285 [Geosiphon pyriformis]
MNMAASLAREKGINVNSNLKKQGIHSDRTVVVKEIPMNMPKEMIVTALAEFGEIKLIKIQLIGLWQKIVIEFAELDQTKQLAAKWSLLIGKDLVCMAIATSRDQFRALLFTLPIRMTAYNLGILLDRAVHCAVVGFESEKELESAYYIEPIFGGVKLFWAKMNLVCCKPCGCFGHSALKCNVPTMSTSRPSYPVMKICSEECHLQLAKLYAKKSILISCPVVFGSKSWVQVVLLASFSGGFYFNFGSGSGSPFSDTSTDKDNTLVAQNDFLINNCLALLKHSLELLADQVSNILCRLNDVELMPLVPVFQVMSPVVSASALSISDTDMVLDVPQPPLSLFSPVVEKKMVDLGLSSSKVLTSKVGSLKSKMVALEEVGSVVCEFRFLGASFASINEFIWKMATCNIISKFDGIWIFTTGLNVGFYGTGVAVIMNNCLAWHVSKMEEISGYLISVCLLFKNKFLVTILGLYAGVSIDICFGQTAVINSMVFKAVNSSSFVILGGNFNENGFGKSTSFKFCLGLGLANTFDGHSLAKASTWCNSRGVKKVINFILVSGNLVSAVTLHKVNDMSEFFDTDYKLVSVLIGLAFTGKPTETNGNSNWEMSEIFEKMRSNNDLNTMWKMLEEAIIQANSGNLLNFNHLIKVWLAIDRIEASKVDSIVLNSVSLMNLIKHLSVVRKKYQKSKYCEFKIAKDTAIRKAIDHYMKNFCSDKRRMIKNILKHLFHKVVLDYLVVNNEIVVEPNEVKLKVDEIMKGWMRKQSILPKMPDLWARQYMPLDYIVNDAFFGVINEIGMKELSLVVDNLPNDKAAELLRIPNKLWKHCGKKILTCLLRLLNLCLSISSVSIIPKPYEWNGVLTNTKPIALVNTAHKILSKILSDWIFLSCSKFNVLCSNNFSVLKGTSTQSPIFTIGSVVKNALEKNREL